MPTRYARVGYSAVAVFDNGYADLDVSGRPGFNRLLDSPDALLLEWLLGVNSPATRSRRCRPTYTPPPCGLN